MTTKVEIHQSIAWFLVMVSVLLIGACAAVQGRYAFHSIEYTTNARPANVEILDWQYGKHGYTDENQQVLPRAPKSYVASGVPINPQSITGMLPVGDFLYVKWREKESGAVHEMKADLTGKLPRDMKNHGIVWLVDGPQLRVFVFPPLQVSDVLGHPYMTVGQPAVHERGKTFLDMPWNAQHQIYP